MNEPYASSYTTLGLKPGSSWKEIRQTYRTLIKKWHPDRFQQDADKHRIAEEKTREITRAYKTLADYHRKHGTTPTGPVLSPSASVKTPGTGMPPVHTGRATTAADAPAANPSPVPIEAMRWQALLILPAIALLFYLWLPDSADRDRDTGPIPQHSEPGHTQPAAGDKAAAHPADRFFTLGSKPGEVYAIQGIPTRTEPGVWHYGKSRVYFVDGGVSRWDSHPDNPLQASLEIDPVITKKKFIQRGSTKDEVRALHGTPWRQTEREWTYGSSRIFFSGDVVTGWEESTVNPLKLQR